MEIVCVAIDLGVAFIYRYLPHPKKGHIGQAFFIFFYLKR